MDGRRGRYRPGPYPYRPDEYMWNHGHPAGQHHGPLLPIPPSYHDYYPPPAYQQIPPTNFEDDYRDAYSSSSYPTYDNDCDPNRKTMSMDHCRQLVDCQRRKIIEGEKDGPASKVRKVLRCTRDSQTEPLLKVNKLDSCCQIKPETSDVGTQDGSDMQEDVDNLHQLAQVYNEKKLALFTSLSENLKDLQKRYDSQKRSMLDTMIPEETVEALHTIDDPIEGDSTMVNIMLSKGDLTKLEEYLHKITPQKSVPECPQKDNGFPSDSHQQNDLPSAKTAGNPACFDTRIVHKCRDSPTQRTNADSTFEIPDSPHINLHHDLPHFDTTLQRRMSTKTLKMEPASDSIDNDMEIVYESLADNSKKVPPPDSSMMDKAKHPSYTSCDNKFSPDLSNLPTYFANIIHNYFSLKQVLECMQKGIPGLESTGNELKTSLVQQLLELRIVIFNMRMWNQIDDIQLEEMCRLALKELSVQKEDRPSLPKKILQCLLTKPLVEITTYTFLPSLNESEAEFLVTCNDLTPPRMDISPSYSRTQQIKKLDSLGIDNLDMSSEKEQCSECYVCGRPTDSTCPFCKEVLYCSEICQLNHWKGGHSQLCSRTKISLQRKDISV